MTMELFNQMETIEQVYKVFQPSKITNWAYINCDDHIRVTKG